MKRLVFSVLLAGSYLQAALPPLAQNVAELRAILNDPRLYELLDSAEVIQEIVHTNGSYEPILLCG